MTANQTTVFVDGFRSLRRFSISMTPGLNILVGPNGSGKTNFIELIDFLHSIFDGSVSRAISSSGGVGRVFSIEELRKRIPHIKCKISGTAEIYENQRAGTDIALFDFKYSIKFKFDKALSTVYIVSEAIHVWPLRAIDTPPSIGSPLGRLNVTRDRRSLEVATPVKISPALKRSSSRNPLNIKSRYYSDSDLRTNLSFIDASSPQADESILVNRYRVPALVAIHRSITSGKSVNIRPHIIKLSDDLTRPPGIDHDGSGLCATLNYLTASEKRREFRFYFPIMLAQGASIDTIVEWTKLVFPKLKSISVKPDHHTGKYIGKVYLENDDIEIPFQGLSDGTLKWLALASLVVTSGSAFSIEEPENFLHPGMQQFLMRIIRDAIRPHAQGSSYIISTHSETIINECRPEEIIIFEFKNGVTTCRRIENPNRVLEEINKTGFRLGYYYASNALS